MSQLPHKPVRLLGDLERRVDEAFAALIHGPWSGPSADFNPGPAIEVRDAPHEYLVLVDLPGVLPEEVHVSIEGHTLLVQGRRTSQQWTQTGAMIFTERFQGEFVRRIPLPSAVDQSGLQLHFEQGLLFIRLPKTPRELTEHQCQ